MSMFRNLSIKSRLIFLVIFSLSLLAIVGIMGLNGMHWSEMAIEDLYNDSLSHTVRLAKINNLIDESRSQMLLSLQHDSNSPFSKAHNHSINRHINEIRSNISEIDKTFAEIKASEMDGEELRLANSLDKLLTEYNEQGMLPVLRALQSSDYHEANRIILEKVNPLFNRLGEQSHGLGDMQVKTAKVYYENAEQKYNSVFWSLIGVLVFALLFSTAIAYMIISNMSRAVHQLNSAAKKIAEGDLTARADYQSRDELGRIARAFNQIGDTFETVINEISSAVSQLSSAANETSTITAQTTAAIQQQRSETEQIATAINEMNATVHEVANNASFAATAAKEADEGAKNGQTIVNATITSIGQLAQEVGEASEVIHSLEKESVSIGSVLDVIRDIAEQTNLLALNAAIEAARAGEQGRGFAVVADEVRTLAGRTQTSTQEIEDMINRLQAGAERAVSVMESGQNQAQDGVSKTAEAGQALEVITSSIDRINDMNSQIASSAEEQSAVAEEINRNIVSISQIAEETALGAEQTASASEDLTQLAAHLQKLVQNFNTHRRK
ncbi:MAG: HAMP domain-containing methyl-accepting chemotaxis protein [Gammaproteobacteria bacterium]